MCCVVNIIKFNKFKIREGLLSKMMNTSVLPSSFVKTLDFSKDKLQEFVRGGLISRIERHREHFAVPPCFMQDPGAGVLEEINNTVLGRWNNKLKSYVVNVENVVNHEKSAGLNEDHRWLHVNVTATYYVYSPEEGQILKGEIKKVGKTAAICIVFDVFTVTVFPQGDHQLTTWTVGEEISFKITSYQHRRKGPLIRAKSTPQSQRTSFVTNSRKRTHSNTLITDESLTPTVSTTEHVEEEEEYSSSKTKKKEKKKKKSKDREEEPMNDGDDGLVETYNDYNGHSWSLFTPNSNHVEVEEEEVHSAKKKKKKKKTKYSE